MCGIAGLLHLDRSAADPAIVRAMTDRLRHRGPDDEGVWHEGPVALGHRRLSILDLSPRGRNPMANEDGTVRLTFNGEVYNHRELKASLRHHAFRSETDTETVVHLYEELGPACVERLNGMFAFALYDTRRRRLVLARDRFGVKPLYYTQVGSVLAFASEVKAFLAVPGFRAKLDPRGLAEHFTFQNTFEDRTLFDGVSMLPAGTMLVVEEGRIARTRYWDLRYAPESGDLKDWAQGLRERFEASVRRQLMSDVPVGSYLSGGMDTGAISAVAARAIPRMHTFTCGFQLPPGASDLERHFDERRTSWTLAATVGTVHHELELGPEAMVAALPRVVWHLDEPRVGISYQVYYTAEMIRRHVTVVLSGVGGDELFAGYPWRYQPVLESREFERDYYGLWMRFFRSDGERDALFTDRIASAWNGFTPADSFRSILDGSRGWDPLHRALHFDFKTFLAGLLVVDDKLSMAHSIEARVPFLDNELVDYVSRIPAGLKLKDGVGKIVLREAMQGLMPAEILAGRKQGFTPPDETWYKLHHAGYIRDLLLGSRALDRGLFRPETVRDVVEDHLNGKRNHRFLLWSLMCLEWWNRLFVDRDPLPPAPKPVEETLR